MPKKSHRSPNKKPVSPNKKADEDVEMKDAKSPKKQAESKQTKSPAKRPQSPKKKEDVEMKDAAKPKPKDTPKDVEMKDAAKSKPNSPKDAEVKDAAKSKPKDAPKDPAEIARLKLKDEQTACLNEVRNNVSFIEKGVAAHDSSLIARGVRRFGAIRKMSYLMKLVFDTYLPASAEKEDILKNLDIAEQKLSSHPAIDEEVAAKAAKDFATPKDPVSLEVILYFRLLVSLVLHDRGCKKEAVPFAEHTVKLSQSQNQRSLDQLAAKAWFHYALAMERVGKLQAIRSDLLAAHRSACVRREEARQAMLSNLILRSCILSNQLSQADKFRLGSSAFPDNASNFQLARNLYYNARIDAVQLEYTNALRNLTQAIRKAPSKNAIGFKETATKFFVIVKLLMGEVPEKTTFTQPDLRRALKPYLKLTQAVRVGNLTAFSAVLKEYSDLFQKDKTFTLIERLHQNVLKTGLRKINMSYSRISLQDVMHKLSLDSIEDTEFIVAKAIADGVIDADIDRKQKFVHSKENIDIYSTTEPQLAFHKRIKYCLDLNNEAIKAMRFPPQKKEEEDKDDDKDKESVEDVVASLLDDDDLGGEGDDI